MALRPEICSLDLNTMWFGSVGGDQHAEERAPSWREAIRAAGVMPELEVFDSGDIQLAHQLLAERRAARARRCSRSCSASGNGFPATPETLLYAKSLLPADAVWAAMGIGRMEFPIVAQACLLGGHVRVGLEDNLYLSKGVLAPSNAALVERAARIVELLGEQRRDAGRGARDPRPAGRAQASGSAAALAALRVRGTRYGLGAAPARISR